MFGYVTITGDTLAPEQQKRYRAYYCGLCRALRERYGNLGRVTLSYDATFLWILLSALYEPDDGEGRERCLPHPFKPHGYVQNQLAGYCADMNIALAYHKCRDDWQDDHSLWSRAEVALLQRSYGQVRERYPGKCAELERCLREIRETEQAGELSPDVPANLTARLLGVIYRYQEDMWADTLQRVGEALGRFIYLMDAYDDLPGDRRRGRYNPLIPLREREDYEDFCRDSLTMLIAEGAEAFETLPLLRDVEILRNILYAGCWSRYRALERKRNKDKPAPLPGRAGEPRPRSGQKEDGA